MTSFELPPSVTMAGGQQMKHILSKTYGVILYTPKGYECPRNCGKTYKFTNSLYVHLKHECGQMKKYACKFCSKTFAMKSKWTMHVGMVHKQIVE